MSERILSLPETLYHALLATAQEKGLTPIGWLAEQLCVPVETIAIEDRQRLDEVSDDPNQPLSTLLDELTGTINSKLPPDSSSDEPHPIEENDPFGDAFIADMARQGIHLP